MCLFPYPFALQGPGVFDSYGVVGAQLRHIVAEGQKKDADADGYHAFYGNGETEAGGVGDPEDGVEEEDEQGDKYLVGLLVLFVAFASGIDSGYDMEQEKHE